MSDNSPSEVIVQHMSTEDTKEAMVRTAAVLHEHRSLLPFKKMADGFTSALFAKESLDYASSKQDIAIGEKPIPFDIEAAKGFELTNVFHSRCLKTKTNATVGLGFETDRVAEVLDPLCMSSFQENLVDSGNDYWGAGTGYLEVVRENPEQENSRIVGLHPLPAQDVTVFLENDFYDFHYVIKNCGDAAGNKGNVRFARFGDAHNMIKRAAEQQSGFGIDNPARVSEVIAFRQPTTFSRWYGFPDWLSGTAVIEVSSMFLQYVFDFFLNRGVPEFMLFVTGAQLGPDDWKKIEDAVKDNIGMGNSHKSVAVNITNAEVNVQLEKLGVEAGLDKEWTNFSNSLDLKMVTSHGVPPLLAGIQTPGKLGANNEMANAMAAFQTLIIGPTQQLFGSTMASTLGDPNKNGGLGLKRTDFLTKEEKEQTNDQTQVAGAAMSAPNKSRRRTRPTLITILDEINVGQMDTLGRMKDQAASPEGQQRDLNAGVQD